MAILAIDTSTNFFAIALLSGNQSVSFISDKANDHSTSLVSEVDALFQKLNLVKESLSEIRFIIGPGSYTGLRIGLTLVKTLQVIYPHIEVFPVTKFEYIYISALPLLEKKELYILLDSGKISDEYFLQHLVKGEMISSQSDIKILKRDEMEELFGSKNFEIIANKKIESISVDYHVEPGNIVNLVKFNGQIKKRNLDIIYVRGIYAKKIF